MEQGRAAFSICEDVISMELLFCFSKASVPKEDPSRLEFSWSCFVGVLTGLNETEQLDAQECNLSSSIDDWREQPTLEMEGDVLEEGDYTFMVKAGLFETAWSRKWRNKLNQLWLKRVCHRICLNFPSSTSRCAPSEMCPMAPLLSYQGHKGHRHHTLHRRRRSPQVRPGGWCASVAGGCHWWCCGCHGTTARTCRCWARRALPWPKSQAPRPARCLSTGGGTGCWRNRDGSWQHWKPQCSLASKALFDAYLFF